MQFWPESTRVKKTIALLFFLIASIVVVNIFLQNDLLDYVCKQTLNISTQLIFGIDLLILALLVALRIKLVRKDIISPKYILILNFCLLFVQLLYAYNIYFLTGWDAGRVLDAVHHVLNTGSFHRINAMYPFFLYPNNLGIFFVLLAIEWASRMVNVDGYLVSVVLSVISVNLAGYVLYGVVKRITQNSYISLFSWILFIWLFGFSPWITIPYTDTYSILFPITAIYIYVGKDQQTLSFRRSFLIGFLLFFGICIKPSVAITLFAIILSIILSIRKWNFKGEVFSRMLSIGFIILGGLPILLGNLMLDKVIGDNLKRESNFTALHYIMMGLNSNRDGVFAGEDVDYSASFETISERNNADLLRIGTRLSDFGFVGYLKHLGRKALVNFADGSFAWAIEGRFFVRIPERSNSIHTILNSFIIKDGANFSNFITGSQLPWYLCLVILPFLVFVPKNQIESVLLIMLSILGIIGFVMLFEARARYLIAYIPVVLVGVAIGYNNLIAISRRIYLQLIHRSNL